MVNLLDPLGLWEQAGIETPDIPSPKEIMAEIQRGIILIVLAIAGLVCLYLVMRYLVARYSPQGEFTHAQVKAMEANPTVAAYATAPAAANVPAQNLTIAAPIGGV